MIFKSHTDLTDLTDLFFRCKQRVFSSGLNGKKNEGVENQLGHYNAHSIGIYYEISLLCSVLPRLGDGDRCPRNRTSAISEAGGTASAPDRHTGRGDCIGCAETGCPAP